MNTVWKYYLCHRDRFFRNSHTYIPKPFSRLREPYRLSNVSEQKWWEDLHALLYASFATWHVALTSIFIIYRYKSIIARYKSIFLHIFWIGSQLNLLGNIIYREPGRLLKKSVMEFNSGLTVTDMHTKFQQSYSYCIYSNYNHHHHHHHYHHHHHFIIFQSDISSNFSFFFWSRSLLHTYLLHGAGYYLESW
jgi:hypothetical protein